MVVSSLTLDIANSLAAPSRPPCEPILANDLDTPHFELLALLLQPDFAYRFQRYKGRVRWKTAISQDLSMPDLSALRS